jgi:hypothetical protein
MQVIETKRGQKILVDDEDYELVSQYVWHFSSRYVKTNLKKTADGKHHTLVIHKLILDVPPGMEVDHINRNTLDNRRANLRICTRAENCRNRQRRSNNISGVKGVCRLPGRPSKWRAGIRVDGKFISLGCFQTTKEAAQAYDKAARKYFGEFAKTNFNLI